MLKRDRVIKRNRFIISGILLSLLLLLLSSCMSAYRKMIGGDTDHQFGRIYITDYNTAWQSTLEALKHSQIDVSNREGGYIQTRWVDNTAEKNFTDSFGSTDEYLKAQYRFRVYLSKGYYQSKPSVKVGVQKEQMVQRDVLEGWHFLETDSIDESTLLYRIGRMIFVKMKIATLNEQKANQELQDNDQGGQ